MEKKYLLVNFMNNYKTLFNLPEMVKVNKKALKILTPLGTEEFYGVNKIKKDSYYHLKFSNNKEIKCSPDHPFITIEGIIKAKDLDKLTEIKSKDGGCFLVSKRHIKKPIELYDIVESGDKNIYYTNDIISHNCEFIGSINTLINPSKLKSLVYEDSLKSNAGLDVYEEPQQNHLYVITVDVSRGTGNDYSAFVVIDVTDIPYKVVAKYRNNEVSPLVYPSVIEKVAKSYNTAYLLIEVNDIGAQIGTTLNYDLEYPNILMCAMRGRAGQLVGHGFSGVRAEFGVKMSKTTKKVGASNLKTLIEDDKLIIKDYDRIQELTSFVEKGNSYEAEDGCNDDLVMGLLIFAWLSVQPYFKEMTNNDIRKKIVEDQEEQLEQDMSPFGFINYGIEPNVTIDVDGDMWFSDEYGSVISTWTMY